VKKFDTVISKAVPLLMPDVDTDIISPLDSLTTDKSVLDVAFAALRYIDGDSDRRELNPDFVLNQPKYQGAQIMLTGENFGCGSSRETAAYSFRDLGFRCLVGSSYSDIFFDNCFQQGLLLVVLPVNTIEHLASQVDDGDFEIDLTPKGEIISFEIDAWRRDCLLQGLDSIDLTLTRQDKIKEFQSLDQAERPWVYRVLTSK